MSKQNIKLLKSIASKIDAMRDKINDMNIAEDDSYDQVFDAIVDIISTLEGASSIAEVTAEEIDTIEI